MCARDDVKKSCLVVLEGVDRVDLPAIKELFNVEELSDRQVKVLALHDKDNVPEVVHCKGVVFETRIVTESNLCSAINELELQKRLSAFVEGCSPVLIAAGEFLETITGDQKSLLIKSLQRRGADGNPGIDIVFQGATIPPGLMIFRKGNDEIIQLSILRADGSTCLDLDEFLISKQVQIRGTTGVEIVDHLIVGSGKSLLDDMRLNGMEARKDYLMTILQAGVLKPFPVYGIVFPLPPTIGLPKRDPFLEAISAAAHADKVLQGEGIQSMAGDIKILLAEAFHEGSEQVMRYKCLEIKSLRMVRGAKEEDVFKVGLTFILEHLEGVLEKPRCPTISLCPSSFSRFWGKKHFDTFVNMFSSSTDAAAEVLGKLSLQRESSSVNLYCVLAACLDKATDRVSLSALAEWPLEFPNMVPKNLFTSKVWIDFVDYANQDSDDNSEYCSSSYEESFKKRSVDESSFEDDSG